MPTTSGSRVPVLLSHQQLASRPFREGDSSSFERNTEENPPDGPKTETLRTSLNTATLNIMSQSQVDQDQPTGEFNLFQCLPLELQLTIFEAALDTLAKPRIVLLDIEDYLHPQPRDPLA